MLIKKNELTILEMLSGSERDIEDFVKGFPRQDFPIIFMNYHVDVRSLEGATAIVLPEADMSEGEVRALVRVFKEQFKRAKTNRRCRASLGLRCGRGVRKYTISTAKALTIFPPTLVVSRAKRSDPVQIDDWKKGTT